MTSGEPRSPASRRFKIPDFIAPPQFFFLAKSPQRMAWSVVVRMIIPCCAERERTGSVPPATPAGFGDTRSRPMR